MIVVGAPLLHGTRVLNCAVVIKGGRVLGVAPKSYLPNYREFYERRHFAPGDDLRGTTIRVAGAEVPLGPDLIFAATDLPDLRLHVEICEDMWVPVPPSAEAALAGATVLSNLSGSPITIARAEDRRLLVRSASFREQRGVRLRRRGPGRVDDRPGVGRPDHGLRVRRPARGRASGSPTGRAARSSTSTSTGSGRSGSGRAPSTTTGGSRSASSRRRRVPDGRVRADAARPATSACAASSTGTRSCPTTSSGWPGLLRGLPHPGRGLMQRSQAIGRRRR